MTGSGTLLDPYVIWDVVDLQNMALDLSAYYELGQASSDAGTGKTTAQMKTLATFNDAGWDIESRTIDKNNGYPYLAWQSVWYIFVWVPPPPALSVFTLPATEIR